MLVEFWQFFYYSLLDDFVVLSESWEAGTQYFFEVIFVDQGAHQPECGHLSSVVKQDGRYEVHPLNIAHGLLIIGKCDQDSFQGALGCRLLKEGLICEGSLDVGIDVGVHLLDHLFEHLAVVNCTIIGQIALRSPICIEYFPA